MRGSVEPSLRGGEADAAIHIDWIALLAFAMTVAYFDPAPLYSPRILREAQDEGPEGAIQYERKMP